MNRHRSREWKQKRVRHSVFLLSSLAAATLIAACVLLLSSSSTTNSQWIAVVESQDASGINSFPYSPEVPRVVYPYSVIPGGVRTAEELRDVSAHDPVVGEHYAGFDFHKARVVEVKQAQLVYLSYRIGDKIYWTAKKVSLHKGEKLITDGTITARTRCANRVAALPQKKRFGQEPAVAEFDKPISGSSMRMPFPENFHSALESRSGPGWGAHGLGPAGPLLPGGSSPLGGGFLPIGSPLVPGGPCSKTGTCGTAAGPGPGPGPRPAPGPTPGPPSVPVPEPGMFGLILADVAAMVLGWKIILRRN